MILEIRNLKKSFKDVKAVDDLSFSVREGELFAFLGVNGAGKSTTINIISGVLGKDEGTVTVCGENIDDHPDKIKGKINIVFQEILHKLWLIYTFSVYNKNKKDFLYAEGKITKIRRTYSKVRSWT